MATVIMTVYFREDAIVYLIKNKRREEALTFIKRVYQSSEDFEKVYSYIESTIKVEDNRVPLKDALLHKNYRRATWITFTLAIFNQMTGVIAIYMYSNTMLVRLNAKDGDFVLTPTQGTYVIGIAGMVGALLG